MPLYTEYVCRSEILSAGYWQLAPLAFCVAFAAIGCGTGPEPDSIDSPVLGKVTAPPAATLSTIPSYPVASLKVVWEAGGSKDSPEAEFDALNGLLDAIELVDGRVVVLDRAVVWLFDRNGKEIWRIGRRGEGPGEFRNLDAGCQFSPGELIVQDGATRRLTVLHLLDGAVRAMFHLDGWRMSPQACLGTNGSILVSRYDHSSESGERPSPDERILIGKLDVATRRVDTLIVIGQPSRARIAAGDAVVAGYLRGVMASDPWFNLVAAFDSNGGLSHIRRLVQWAQVESGEIVDQRGTVAGGSGRPQREPSIHEGTTDRLVPVAEWMEVGPEGDMWVKDPVRSQDSIATWTCVNPAGVPKASLQLRSRPFAAATMVMGVGKSGLILRGSDTNGAAILRIVSRPEKCL